MKKILLFILLLCSCFPLCGCQKKLKGTNELIEKAREVIPVSDADTITIEYAGIVSNNDTALIWFISGSDIQSHYYLPMECTIVGKNEYVYERIYEPMDRGEDTVVLEWNNGYAFLINNPICKTVRIVDNNGIRDYVNEKEVYPYIFYNSQIPSEYVFLDKNGNEIY